MPLSDSLGLPLTDASIAGVEHYLRAVHELQCFVGDPVGSIDAAIEADPGFVMAHVFKGYLYGLSTDREAMAVARQCHESASRLSATQREKAHVAALGALAGGGWNEAGRILEDVTIEHPLDGVALQAGHQIDFFTGNARMLRDRMSRALPAWERTMPGYHAMLGMQAFGFEEMGDYATAERLGRAAIDIEPRDGWAQHAVAHVMEMQCRQRDGIAWMRANPENWTKESFLQIHNWWHLALFHYDLGETDAVLALYDGPIRAAGSTLALNLVDASAILWRLYLGGVDVGDRWTKLADLWAPKATAGNYAFNDIHAMMAFVGAGRADLAASLLDAQRDAIERAGDNAAFTRDIGHPISRGMLEFGEGNFSAAVKLIRPVRTIAHRFGGSHAQRDVIDLTLVEAAIRSGDAHLASALTAERAAARPDSPLSQLFVRRAATLPASPTP